jgi:redox-sensitive bicupin YhaK (pirin superfamily)
MIERRPFNKLAGEDRDWLKARHHFRFSGGDNGASMGWGSLRIWNDDEIAPGAGFPPHAHANMEIITFVREGTVTHRDSLGNEGKTKAGDVQVMSAGTGIRHAEYNMEQVPARIFQIWITPDSNGGSPTWGSQPFPKADRSGRLVAFASGFESDIDALPIRARARVLGAKLEVGQSVEYALGERRHAYLVPSSGTVDVNGVRIHARDGAAITDVAIVRIAAIEDADVVMVDVPQDMERKGRRGIHGTN